MRTTSPAALSALFGLLLVNAVATAAESAPAPAPAPGRIDKVWTIVPKNGSETEFEKAFATHVQWRRDNNDPWRWQVYVQVDGPEVGTYYARSGNHHWGDFDAYDASQFVVQADAHWNATVAPLVAKVRSSMGEDMPGISQWPADAPDYMLFQLYTYHLKPGHMKRFEDATTAIVEALKEAKWPYHWAFVQQMTGRVPSVLLVLPATKWADFAEPDPDVVEAVASVRTPEKAGEMFAAMSATFAQTEVVTVRRIPQLSVPAPQ